MSLADNYTTSEESQYSDSYTTEATSSGEEYPMLGSSLLSNPANQISSSSGEEEPINMKTQKNKTLSCPSGSSKKQYDSSSDDDGSYEGSSGSEEDEANQEDGITVLTKPLPSTTTNKVVPLSTLKKAATPMGTLTPINKAKTSEPLSNKLTPLSSLSAQELEVLAIQQEKRLSKPLPSKNLSSKLIPLSALSASELEEVVLQQEKRANATMPPPIISAEEQQLHAMDNRFGNFLPLTSLSGKEIDQVRANQAERLSSMKRVTTASKLTPFSAMSDEQYQAFLDRQDQIKKPAVSYKLEKISDLSAQQRDELFVQQRMRMMAHIKPISSLTPQELNALEENVTSLNCPLDIAPVDSLGIEQLRELVNECRAKHQRVVVENNPLKHVMSVNTRKIMAAHTTFAKQNSQITLINAHHKELPLSSNTKEPIVLKSQHTLSVEKLSSNSPLVNFNTLSVEKQNEIREKLASKKNFQNKQSSVSAKKEFDVKLGNSILSSSAIQTLYHGLSANLSCPSSTGGCSQPLLIDYMKSEQPAYMEILKKNMDRGLLESMMNSKDRNIFFIVPSDALLALYRQQGALLKIAKLATAYLTVLLKRGETIPADNKCYSCANLLKDNRVVVRRLDDETLLIDNEMTAKLDPRSGGRAYKMIGPAPRSMRREPRVTEVVEETTTTTEPEPVTEEETVTTTTTTVDPVTGEETSEISEETSDVSTEEEELPASTTTTTTTTTMPAEPQVVSVLPDESEEKLAIVPISEVSARLNASSIQLRGLYKNSPYKNLKVVTLTSKMLNADYSGSKHMANYIDHSDVKAQEALVYLKTFAYDDLYTKYVTTTSAITGSEHLSPAETFTLSSPNDLNYALGGALNMKEFTIDTKKTKISKVNLMNHFAVLCFKNKDNQFVTTSFSLPDETESPTDTYMSADESLLLKFKNNILNSIVLNTDASTLTLAPLSEPFAKKSLITGKDTDIAQQITVQVPIAENAANLYAKDLSYAQFLSVVIPLSQPSFYQRSKHSWSPSAGESRKMSAILKLQRVTGGRFADHQVELSAYEQLKENTASLHMGITPGVYEKVKEYKRYTFHRVVLRNPVKRNDYMVRYDFDEALNTDQVSFNSLINYTKASQPPILSIKLVHPFMKKRKVFRFQLPVARQPPQEEESLYEARSSDGLHFDFGLAPGGKLMHIYIRYTHYQPPRQDLLSQFLSVEAYAYKKHNLSIIPNYMSHRLNKFATLSQITPDKLDTQLHTQFFASLNKEIEQFMEKEELTPLLCNAPDTKITLEKDALIAKSGYKVPQPEETKQYQSAILSTFAMGQSAKTITPAKNVLDAVVKEYSTLSNNASLKDLDFALYMNRFKHIANHMMSTFSVKK